MALIDIASQKQLFVDDYLIESTSHCVQMVNRAEKVAGNPVLRSEHPGKDPTSGWTGCGGTMKMVICLCPNARSWAAS